ncbi:hypothetical protein [Fusibacter sp. JL216-2]|uniref:hypothetical protein n=1 Tax=Fusibacter sp. JL216-2 TaxID=3071453 RepID=UPI003D334461
MLKTLKHPLFKREILQVRWSSLLMTLAVMLPILITINHAHEHAYGWRLESMDILANSPYDFLGWLIVPIIIISQFYYTRKDSVSGVMAALPFSRKDTMKHKYLAGACGILFAYTMSFIILTATYFSAGQPIIGPYSPILYWFIIAYLSSLFQYSFYFLVATTMGNSIFAGIAGILIFYAPVFLYASVMINADAFFNISYSGDGVFQVLMPQYIVYTSNWYNKSFIGFMDILPMIIGYTLVSYLLFKGAQGLFEKNDFEHNGNMCMFIWAEKLFLVGFTLCFGFLALDFSQIFEGGWLYPIVVVLGLACFPMGFILARKLLLITGHQVPFKKA